MTSSPRTAGNQYLKNENRRRIFCSGLCINQRETYNTVMSVLLCVPLWRMRNFFVQQKQLDKVNLTLGQICQKRKAFLRKNPPIGAQVHLFAVSMCQNHVVSDDCCGMPFCTETALIRHCSASNFDLFSLVARLLPVFVTSHTYRIC